MSKTPREKLQSLIDESQFKRLFDRVTFTDEGLEVPGSFQAGLIEQQYAAQLEIAFGCMPKITIGPAARAAVLVQLPLWPEPTRGTPNSFLRSALFAAIQGKGRRQMKKELLGAQKGYAVRFTGTQLDQSDLDVWEHAIHLARSHPLGNVCCFRANAFLKAIGRSNGKQNYEWLNDSITRLVACAVEVRNGGKVFTGSLLSSCARDEETGIYKLRLDPDTVKLYGPCDWTLIEWKQREALKGKPLALWLHGYYASHKEPYPVKVETLRELSGSATKAKKHFTAALKRAFKDLEGVAAIKASFQGDLVTVEKSPRLSSLR